MKYLPIYNIVVNYMYLLIKTWEKLTYKIKCNIACHAYTHKSLKIFYRQGLN